MYMNRKIYIMFLYMKKVTGYYQKREKITEEGKSLNIYYNQLKPNTQFTYVSLLYLLPSKE